MRLLWIMLVMLALLTGAVSAEGNYSQHFEDGTCPNSSTADALLYIFFGVCLVALLIYSERANFGAGLILAGLFMIPYALPLFGCYTMWGFVIILFAVAVLVYAIKFKDYGGSE